jgi:CBS domain-containing protein
MKTTVAEVMSSPAVVVQVGAPFKEVVETLQRHGIGVVPVVDVQGLVVGVVSESDLMLREEGRELEGRRHLFSRRTGGTGAKVAGDIAAEVMSSPAITIRPQERIDRAAHVLHERHVHHLAVVDEEGHPRGVVSRGDLLKVFLRSDDQIREAVIHDLLERTLWLDPTDVTVEVEAGIVHVAGKLSRKTDVQLVERLVPTVDGVVDVKAELTYRFDDTKTHRDPSPAHPGW